MRIHGSLANKPQPPKPSYRYRFAAKRNGDARRHGTVRGHSDRCEFPRCELERQWNRRWQRGHRKNFGRRFVHGSLEHACGNNRYRHCYSRKRFAGQRVCNSSAPKWNHREHRTRRGKCGSQRNAKFHNNRERWRKFGRELERKWYQRRRRDKRHAQRNRTGHCNLYSSSRSTSQRGHRGRHQRGGPVQIRIGERNGVLPVCEFCRAVIGDRDRRWHATLHRFTVRLAGHADRLGRERHQRRKPINWNNPSRRSKYCYLYSASERSG